MIDQIPLSYYLLLSAILFTIGAGGVLIRHHHFDVCRDDDERRQLNLYCVFPLSPIC